MPVTVLYPEARQTPDELEREVFGSDVRILKRDTNALSELSEADCAEADGLMILGFPVTGADMARFPKLRAIVRMGVGYDKLDRPAAAARNILICNVPDYGTTEVADHAIALALTLRRGILLHHELQRADPPAPWRSFQDPMIQRLGTQTFGIVGLGRIGTAVALRAKAFNFRVAFYDPHLPNGVELSLGISRAATLEDLLRQTDTLSIHAPLTPETNGMFNAARIGKMKRTAFLVNTARGGIVDEKALYDALKANRIAGAALDVFVEEPTPNDNPLLTLPNFIAAPHVAGVTREAVDRMAVVAVQNILSVFDGKPTRDNVINKEVLG